MEACASCTEEWKFGYGAELELKSGPGRFIVREFGFLKLRKGGFATVLKWGMRRSSH